MCTVFEARHSTQDLDASFRPVRAIREAVQRIASAHDYPEHWLNDAVKGFLSDRGQFNPYLQLSHLQVFTASAAYLLAMKCLAMRLGAEFHDEQDIRYLLRYLNVADYAQALGIIEQYYPLQRFPQKTLYALQELLEGT